jgi:hypothetical protein
MLITHAAQMSWIAAAGRGCSESAPLVESISRRMVAGGGSASLRPLSAGLVDDISSAVPGQSHSSGLILRQVSVLHSGYPCRRFR